VVSVTAVVDESGRSYTEEEIFSDEEVARQFRTDLQRMREHGRPLTLAAGSSQALTEVKPAARATWRNWVDRQVAAIAAHGAEDPPVPVGFTPLVTRIVIQLLGHGVWDLDDGSWREVLAELAAALVSDDRLSGEARQAAVTEAAICMGLLRGDASLTGGAPADLVAARTWKKLERHITEADPDLAGTLLMPPRNARAVVLSYADLEQTIMLSWDDDPAAILLPELATRGWELSREESMYRVSGSFSNPVMAVARVATLLGDHLDTVLVHAHAGNRWAFVLWHRPDLVLAHVPGNTWRHYRLDGSATPASRLGGGEGLTNVGLVGRPVRIGQIPTAEVQELLVAAGTDHLSLLELLCELVAGEEALYLGSGHRGAIAGVEDQAGYGDVLRRVESHQPAVGLLLALDVGGAGLGVNAGAEADRCPGAVLNHGQHHLLQPGLGTGRERGGGDLLGAWYQDRLAEDTAVYRGRH
jgi:hypothetical protein